MGNEVSQNLFISERLTLDISTYFFRTLKNTDETYHST